MPSLASSRSDPNATTSSSSTPSALSAKLLQHHLSHTTISPDECGIPSALPTSPSYPSPAVSRNINSAPPTSSEPLNFTSFLSLFPSIDASSPAPVFRLGSALFDPVDLRLGRSKRNGLDSGTSITPDIRNRVSTLRRKAALSKWLEDVVKPNVDGDLLAYTAADAAFTHLTGHQISQASASAADGGYIKLSTLISQAGGDDLFKDYILSQLEIWKSEKLSPGSNAALTSSPNGLVGRSVWRVYKLLSGLIQYEGPDTRAGDDIFTGLDWKRVFGLCLWYGTSVDASVSDVVKVYESILEESQESDVSRPVPKWIASKPKKGLSSSLGSSPLGLFAAAQQTQPEDPLYILIKLHADPALSLSKALNPLSFAPTGLDWGIGMCWHLYIILSRVMRIRDFADRGNRGIRPTTRRPGGSLVNGFGGSDRDDSSTDGLSNQGDDSFPPEGHSPSADLLTTGYAFILESWGMLQEAAFVLMHLEGSAGRAKALKELLARSAPNLDDWMTRGLVGSLKLPMYWVDEAKATYELDQGNIYTAYELYISAQLFNAAHNLALLDLAPDAVIRKDLGLLRNLFAPFDMVGRRDKVENWFVRGKVFLDYMEIMTKLPKLLNEVAAENEERPSIPDATQEAAMDELSKRALKTISLLPDILHRSRQVDPRHPAALEEMSKDLLKLVERVKPLLLTRIQPPTISVFDGATKINLVRGIGYARFLQSIEA
ncbi:nuclear protein 96-domain-containing protein [Gymnopilus junonius]|uniref:Nuclear protein 96-domain-containing protein n=1 Tax=Gymnopilus junonius TaxID=109634 RepID=A0A9P5NJT9_GYMJU|nr:nuclear protein 96-domain-containing protein [Gymnopilus junonius]